MSLKSIFSGFQKPLGPHALFPPRPGKICHFLKFTYSITELVQAAFVAAQSLFLPDFIQGICLIAVQVCTVGTCWTVVYNPPPSVFMTIKKRIKALTDVTTCSGWLETSTKLPETSKA